MFKSKKIKKEVIKAKKSGNSKNIEDFKKLYNSQNFQTPVLSDNKPVVVGLIFSILFGALAGFGSAKIFVNKSNNILEKSDKNNGQVLSSKISTIVNKKDEKVTVIDDEKIINVEEKVSPSVVGIFKHKALQNDINQDIYNNSDFVGNGFVLTNDGWVVCTNDVVNLNNSYIIVTQDNIIYKVKEKRQDTQFGLVYLKVDAENLRVAGMNDFNNLKVGQRTILINGLNHFNKKVLISRITNKSFQINSKNIQTTEQPYLFVLIDNNFNSQLSVPLFNLDKEFVGLTTSYNNLEYIIPASYIKKSFDKILNKEKIQAYLGLEYVNLSTVIIENYNATGALITKIKRDSPLKDKNIAIGDVILEVNDYIINGKKNFTNLIQEYKTGDKIKLVVFDKTTKDQKEIEVVLK